MTKYILLVFAGACSFGILSTFVKLSYRSGYTAAEISGSQAFTGMLVLWLLYLLLERKKVPQQVPKRQYWQMLLTGATIGITTFVYYLSVHWIPASVAIVLMMQFSWIGLLLEWIFFRQKPQPVQLLAILLILAGTALASGFSFTHLPALPLIGVLTAFGSGVLYAVYIVANGRIRHDLPLFKRSALMMTGSAAAIFLVNSPALIHSTHADAGLLKWALFLSFFGTIIPPVLFSKGIPKIGATMSAIIMTVELPVAVLCAHFILHEPIAPLQWAGIALMLLSIALVNLRRKQPAAGEG
ncbi:EamA family transporter [Chitinophaga nivalis]|uniref:DMT family transporter n=1 Tax=Chitinophaga nivalis TaxID=2991709 RepID=A0ABT3IP60_9BACT|nr:DMT family transporter [Chitinophaga nivalis]MCW3464548.1 DMT family transporter [Chitinophaga nivalis]MCW3485761.1 DMT family transporter [Chitinophaga nivalis]